jgi:N6-L-threonylcarbamoyladenine synthase
MSIVILGIESSCDDTSAAIIKDGYLLSNIIANQKVHENYGGVVPELASRAHQKNIIPVVDQAIKLSGISMNEISAVAFTNGPGLMGSLLVGTSFSKGFALARNLPIIDINHLQAHILVHFILEQGISRDIPKFPFLCMLISGGHTQLLVIKDFLEFEIIGQTIDDAVGEAFDKCAKVMGLPYPGGPAIDKMAQQGDPNAFKFSKPVIEELDFSFSGLKTSFLYFLRDQLKENADFIEARKADLCASLQQTIITILLDKLRKASKLTGINQIALAGGVSANSGLRAAALKEAEKLGWTIYIPELKFTTDNAAMVAITGYYKFLAGQFASQDITPVARVI